MQLFKALKSSASTIATLLISLANAELSQAHIFSIGGRAHGVEPPTIILFHANTAEVVGEEVRNQGFTEKAWEDLMMDGGKPFDGPSVTREILDVLGTFLSSPEIGAELLFRNYQRLPVKLRKILEYKSFGRVSHLRGRKLNTTNVANTLLTVRRFQPLLA